MEYFTIGYNSLEGLLAIIAGLAAGSVALVGFGLDSAIEVTSGAALLWRLRADADLRERIRAEARALRIVGVCFLALAAYVGADGLHALWAREAPQHSLFGIILAAVSVVVMPVLSRRKRQTASQIGSAALAADATQTQLCTFLSAILLSGLLLNATLGWWWADPAAALIMVPIIAYEGAEALRGKTCCDCG